MGPVEAFGYSQDADYPAGPRMNFRTGEKVTKSRVNIQEVEPRSGTALGSYVDELQNPLYCLGWCAVFT